MDTNDLKVGRTFKAMCWGWVALVLLLPVFVDAPATSGNPLDDVFKIWCLLVIFSPPVILMAWLFILLPVDCLLSESSWFRTPWVAAIGGGVVGMASVIGFLIDTKMTSFAVWWTAVQEAAASLISGSIIRGAAIVGFTAALYITLKFPRKRGL